MDDIIDIITFYEKKISDRDPMKKIYTHTLIELKRLNEIFHSSGEYYDGICFIDPQLTNTLNRYLDRLKKIKAHYYELVEDLDFPDMLRSPVIIYGDVIKIKKEIRQSLDSKPKELLHLTLKECKAKHIEIDDRLIVVMGNNSVYVK